MGKLNLRRDDVKTIKNTMGKLNMRRCDVKTMKTLWESSIREEAL